MNKYTILIVLNVPFIILGYLRTVLLHKSGKLQRVGFFMRLLFWTILLIGLIFAESIYNYLSQERLTDSPPLSIADVVLVTGVLFGLTLCMRLYAKVDQLERRLNDIHEELSIKTSIKK